MDGADTWSNGEGYSFTIECGPGSTNIQVPTVSEILEFNLDYDQPLRQPYFVIPLFDPRSVCPIVSYEVYAERDPAVVHPDFVEGYEDLADEGLIRFKLSDSVGAVLEEYEFYIKATAEGGDFAWSDDDQYTFAVRCSEGSANIEDISIPHYIPYEFDDQ